MFSQPSILARVCLSLIRAYQHTLSPDHGPMHVFFPMGACRYEETCSQFTYRAIEEHGLRGIWRGLKRLSTCHPFARV